jgi:microcystin-dependent protein
MARREYKGGAAQLILSSGIASSGVTSISTTGTATGWPTGTGKFLVVIDKGTASEEKLYCVSRTGNTLTVASDADRGADGTAAVSHSSGATVNHVGGAIDLDEANQHIFDTAQDQHTQYLNTTRHAAVAHTGAMIQDLAVGTADLADNAVTYAKMEVGQRWEPGDMKMTFRTTATSGWLMCDGALVSTTTYADLFAAIGHSGNGGVDPGGGNFKLPDLRQRFAMGKAASGTGSTLGGTGGSKDAVVVSHNHTQDSHNHTQNGHSHTQDSHGHTVSETNTGNHQHGISGDIGSRYAISHAAATNGLVGSPVEKATFSAMDSVGAHAHSVGVNGQTATNQSFTATNQVQTATNQATGVSATDANLPGYQVVNYMIKI